MPLNDLAEENLYTSIYIVRKCISKNADFYLQSELDLVPPRLGRGNDLRDGAAD
jgi:hypothetical protein